MVDPIVTTRELWRHALAKRATGLGYELLPIMGIVGNDAGIVRPLDRDHGELPI